MELRFAPETHPFPGSDRDGDRGRGRDQMVPYHQPLLPANDREVAPQLLAIEDIKIEEDDSEEGLEQPPEGFHLVSWQWANELSWDWDSCSSRDNSWAAATTAESLSLVWESPGILWHCRHSDSQNAMKKSAIGNGTLDFATSLEVAAVVSKLKNGRGAGAVSCKFPNKPQSMMQFIYSELIIWFWQFWPCLTEALRRNCGPWWQSFVNVTTETDWWSLVSQSSSPIPSPVPVVFGYELTPKFRQIIQHSTEFNSFSFVTAFEPLVSQLDSVEETCFSSEPNSAFKRLMSFWDAGALITWRWGSIVAVVRGLLLRVVSFLLILDDVIINVIHLKVCSLAPNDNWLNIRYPHPCPKQEHFSQLSCHISASGVSLITTRPAVFESWKQLQWCVCPFWTVSFGFVWETIGLTTFVWHLR